MNLEIPKRFKAVVSMAHEVGASMFRPIARKYDRAEHAYPKELDALRPILDGMDAGGAGLGAKGLSRDQKDAPKGTRNGRNLAMVLNVMELCWGDLGLMLSIPGQGLGNAAIAAVATPEQKAKFRGKWAAMAITEPGAGSDSAAIKTTAVLDGDQWVLNGEKIFVTCGERADVIVVWASIDPSAGRAAIKSFVVERGTPGFEVARLEHKLGIRASDTATLVFSDCRIPRENLLGTEEVKRRGGFAGVMQTFDNTRPVVAAMACGVARAALERTRELLGADGITPDYRRMPRLCTATQAELVRLEAELEASRLLTLQAAWMADNRQPNSRHASIAKAKAGRMATELTLKCIELCGPCGYVEDELLEKWARDAKICDIFEGTQQIQLLIIARSLLGKSSRDLR
ncbi:MAG: acyl-CoA dehydrogenase family protein [Nannocystaceae bacterium]